MEKRAFRSPESLALEARSRDLVSPFLKARGIESVRDDRRVTGTAVSQTLQARLPDGTHAMIRVKLCWRRDDRNAREMSYSATQLVARRLASGWQETLDGFVERNQRQGVTHLLLAQPEAGRISLAALIPLQLVPGIWWRQYEASEALIREGRLGRATKNHAANGDSPTLWLQDDRFEDGHRVADALWEHPGVMDLRRAPSAKLVADEDTFDDCPVADSAVGRDDGARVPVMRSAVPRDPAVREQVRHRAAGTCERCGLSKRFPGFLDVHHVMGVEKSDRTWTCVALCPNCHREAHVSPEADSIKEELSTFALRFKPV